VTEITFRHFLSNWIKARDGLYFIYYSWIRPDIASVVTWFLYLPYLLGLARIETLTCLHLQWLYKVKSCVTDQPMNNCLIIGTVQLFENLNERPAVFLNQKYLF